MKYAQVSSGLVTEVFTPQPGFTIEESFTPEVVALFQPCPEEVEANWIQTSDGTFLPPLSLEPVNVSNRTQSAYTGSSLTLNCEYSCGDCEVVYEWLNPGGLPIPGAIGSSLTLSNLTEKFDGTYTCNVSASNDMGQTGYAFGAFTVDVYPAIVPGAVAE